MTEDKDSLIAERINQVYCQMIDLTKVLRECRREFNIIRDELENIAENQNHLVTLENIGFNQDRISYYKYYPPSEETASKLYISFGTDNLQLEDKEADRIYKWLVKASSLQLQI
ncbi:MAG: hypothetical protein KA714_26025 [Limnoraphis sp. WC205]|jgi:hypothetical protein|nr:hypothetical protein [Limnoraphis sp. WC205]